MDDIKEQLRQQIATQVKMQGWHLHHVQEQSPEGEQKENVVYAVFQSDQKSDEYYYLEVNVLA